MSITTSGLKINNPNINAFYQKHGVLTVYQHDGGQGPTATEIFERMHGYPMPRLVNYEV